MRTTTSSSVLSWLCCAVGLLGGLGFPVCAQASQRNGAAGAPRASQAAPRDRLVTVMLTLAGDPVAVARSRAPGRRLTKDDEKALADNLRRKQDALDPAIEALGGTVLSKVQYALNAVKVRVPANQLDALARLPGVVAVKRVPNSTPTGQPERPGTVRPD
jgi:minor extracellular serine protease Vpr